MKKEKGNGLIALVSGIVLIYLFIRDPLWTLKAIVLFFTVLAGFGMLLKLLVKSGIINADPPSPLEGAYLSRKFGEMAHYGEAVEALTEEDEHGNFKVRFQESECCARLFRHEHSKFKPGDTLFIVSQIQEQFSNIRFDKTAPVPAPTKCTPLDLQDMLRNKRLTHFTLLGDHSFKEDDIIDLVAIVEYLEVVVDMRSYTDLPAQAL
ncbi:MAG: hypothetical protein LBQ81_10390 [Zoogloeaceae bacterium]|jgi:hypothetical protein|nr:hypothetical protein [Zoogloeaceae bacterium]